MRNISVVSLLCTFCAHTATKAWRDEYVAAFRYRSICEKVHLRDAKMGRSLVSCPRELDRIVSINGPSS